MYAYLFIYIYIWREREMHLYMCRHIYIYIYTHTYATESPGPQRPEVRGQLSQIRVPRALPGSIARVDLKNAGRGEGYNTAPF